MRHGVGLAGNDVDEPSVYLPEPESDGHFLVLVCGVAPVRVEAAVVAVFVALGDVTAGVHLVIHLSLHGRDHADKERKQ